MAMLVAGCSPNPPQPTQQVVTIVPQGTILFSGASAQTDGQFALYVMNADGSNRQVLAQLKGDALGAKWSPDGRQIVTSIEQDGVAQLFVMDADGRNQRQLTRVRSAINAEWAPDGRRIAFVSGDSGQQDVYVINADGTGLRRLTRTVGNHLQPAWSPDGKAIAYSAVISSSAEYGQTYQLWVTDLDGAAYQLTQNSAANYQYPSWSRDGARLVFAADPTGVYEIYVMDFASKDVKPLTSSGDPTTAPRFSPDDKLIVYSVFGADGWRLHLMTAEGRAHTPIDNKAVDEFFPDWKK